MKTLEKKLLLAMGVTTLAVSMTTVQAETIAISSSNISCTDLPMVLGSDWPSEVKTLFQVVAATEYGAAVTGQGGDFTMLCGGREVFPDNAMEKLTASNGDTEMNITPVAIDVKLIGGASSQDEVINVNVQGNVVVVEFVVDDEASASTRSRRLYEARLRFNGNIRER